MKQSRDREWGRAYTHFTWLRGCSVYGDPKETPDSHTFVARAQNTADGQVAKGESEVGALLDTLPRIMSKLCIDYSYWQGSSITDIRVFVRGRIARNPAVLQPGLIGPFVRNLRLPRPHDPPARLLVCDHLSFPRLPQERLVALTERRAGPSQPLAAADVARSSARSVVTRADAPSVEVPRAVRHGGCPLPNDGPQLVFIEVLEVVTLAARSGYMLRLRLQYALADRAMLPMQS